MRLVEHAVSILATVAIIASAPRPAAQSQSQPVGAAYEFHLPASKQWLDTNLDLRAGARLRITATGSITYPAGPNDKPPARTFGPDGLERSWRDLIHQYAVPNAGHGALIARLGSGDAAQPFLVSASKDFIAPVANRLFLGLNQSHDDASSATGSFHVTIEILDAGAGANGSAASVALPANAPIPAITAALLDKIPRRVSDAHGNPGDMVNILIVGTQDQLVKIFSDAGWVQVDSSVEDTVLAAVLDSLEKKDYLTMPMSRLYLFDRAQDYGFAHAEPVRVAMSRNHLRVWKSPYTVSGRPLWCIAATHDIGFERDQRHPKSITHKIDPAIDAEREYVNETLAATGLVAARTHIAPPDPLTEASTATGGSFHSDGRLLILLLKNSPPSK
jgi:LssY C-terminus